jgi:hypothetical protein
MEKDLRREHSDDREVESEVHRVLMKRSLVAHK